MKSLRTVLVIQFISLVVAASLVRGEIIKNDFRVSQDTRHTVRLLPQVAFDSLGNFAAVWADYGANNYDQCYLQRFDSLGRPIGPTVLISDTTTYYLSGYPTVAVRGDGEFVVAWSQGLLVNADPYLYQTEIMMQIYSPLGLPLTPKIKVDVDRPTIYQDHRFYDSEPKVAMDKLGNFVVIWEGQDSVYFRSVWGQLYEASGQRIGNNFRISDQTGASIHFGYEVQRPMLAMKKDGAFVVSWFGDAYYPSHQLGSVPVARAYNSDGSPRTPLVSLVNVEATPLLYGGYAHAAFLTNGKIALAWEGNHPDALDGNVLNVQVFDSLLNPLGTAAIAGDIPNIYIDDVIPVVASQSTGNFVVFWGDNRNGHGNFWAQRFNAQGNRVGEKLQN